MKFFICILMYLLFIVNAFRAIGTKDDENDWSLVWAWFSGFQLAIALVMTFQLTGVMN